jgi:hypothetical protein
MSTPLTRIQLRRGDSNLWDPTYILNEGEPAFEKDTKYLRIGDGSTAYKDLLVYIPRPPSYISFTITSPVTIPFTLTLGDLTTDPNVNINLRDVGSGDIIQTDSISPSLIAYTMTLTNPLLSNRVYYATVDTTSSPSLQLALSSTVSYAPINLTLSYINPPTASLSWNIDPLYSYNISIRGYLALNSYKNDILSDSDISYSPYTSSGSSNNIPIPGTLSHGDSVYFTLTDDSNNVIGRTQTIKYNQPGIAITMHNPQTLRIVVNKSTDVVSYLNKILNVKLNGDIVYSHPARNFTSDITTVDYVSDTPLVYGTYTCELDNPYILQSNILDYTPIVLSNLQFVDSTRLLVTVDYNSGQFYYDSSAYTPNFELRSSNADGSSTTFVQQLAYSTLTSGTETINLTTSASLVNGTYYMVAVYYTGHADDYVNYALQSTAFVVGTPTYSTPLITHESDHNAITTDFSLGSTGYPINAYPEFALYSESNAPENVIPDAIAVILRESIPTSAPYATGITYTLVVTTDSILSQGTYVISPDSENQIEFDFVPYDLLITDITATQLTVTFQNPPTGSTLSIASLGLSKSLTEIDTTHTFSGTFTLGTSYTVTITKSGSPTATANKSYAYEGISISGFSIANNISYSATLSLTDSAIATIGAISGGENYFIRVYDTSNPGTIFDEETISAPLSNTVTLSASLPSNVFQSGKSYRIQFAKNSTALLVGPSISYNPITIRSFGVRDIKSLYSTIAWNGTNISPLKLSVYRVGGSDTLVATVNIATTATSFVIPSPGSQFVNSSPSSYKLTVETQTGSKNVYTYTTNLTNVVSTQFGSTLTVNDVVAFAPTVTTDMNDTPGKVSIFFNYTGFSGTVLYPSVLYPFTPTISVNRYPFISGVSTSLAVPYNTANISYFKYTTPTYTSGGLLNFNSGSTRIADTNTEVPSQVSAGKSLHYRIDLNTSSPPRCGIYSIGNFGSVSSYTSTFLFAPVTLNTDFISDPLVSSLTYLNRKEYSLNFVRNNAMISTFINYSSGAQYTRYITKASDSSLYYLLYAGMYLSASVTILGTATTFDSGKTVFPLTNAMFTPGSRYYPALLYNDSTGTKSFVTNLASTQFIPSSPTLSTPIIDSAARTITFTFNYASSGILYNTLFVPKVGTSATSGGTYTFISPSLAKITPSGSPQVTINLTNGYTIIKGTSYTVVLTLSSLSAGVYYTVGLFTPPSDDDEQFEQGATGTKVQSSSVYYDPIVFGSGVTGSISNTTDLSYTFVVSSGGGNLTSATCILTNKSNNRTVISSKTLISASGGLTSSISAGTYTILVKPSLQTPSYNSSSRTFTLGVDSTASLTNNRFGISNLYSLALSFVSPSVDTNLVSNDLRYSPNGYDIIILAGETNMTGADGQSLSVVGGRGSAYTDPDPNMRWSQSGHGFLDNLLVVNTQNPPGAPVTNSTTTTGIMYNYSFNGTSQTNMTGRNVSMGEEFLGLYITYIKETNRDVIVIPISDRRTGFFDDPDNDGLDTWRNSTNFGAGTSRYYLTRPGRIYSIPELSYIMTNYGSTSSRITRIAAFLWHGGEYDANQGSFAWHSSLAGFKKEFDDELIGYDGNYSDKKYPFIVSQIPQTWGLGKCSSTSSSTYINNCCACISTTNILNNSSALCVSSLGLPGILYNSNGSGDISSCFSNRSQRHLANRHMNAYLSLDYTAPNSSSVAGINSAPFTGLEVVSLPSPSNITFTSPTVSWESCSNSWNHSNNASFYVAKISYGGSVFWSVLTEYISAFSSNQGSPPLTVPFDAPAGTSGCWISGVTINNTSPTRYTVTGSSRVTLGNISTPSDGTINVTNAYVFPIFRTFNASIVSRITQTQYIDTLGLNMSTVSAAVSKNLASFSQIIIYSVSSTITNYDNSSTFSRTFTGSNGTTFNR